MNIKGIATTTAVIIAFLLVSCQNKSTVKELNPSSVESIEITSSNLTHIKKVNIYLPVGYDADRTYPAIYMECGRLWEEDKYKHFVDSLIESGTIEPVIVICSQEDNMRISDTHFYYEAEFSSLTAKGNSKLENINKNYESYFLNELLTTIETTYPVSKEKEDRIFFGTSHSADFGISLGMKYPDLFDEYWCFSPGHSSVEQFGKIPGKTKYRICWGTKETVNADDYYPSLTSGIRKRGGSITHWVFEGRPNGFNWKKAFKKCLIEKFGTEKTES